jgi:DNA-binding transcriptional MerR regulator
MKIDEMARTLDMSPSTVKKYYLLVEQHGYRFKRNQQGHVMFSEQDLQLFRKLIQMKNEPGITLPKAVEKVMSLITDITVITDEVITDTTPITVMTEKFETLKELFLNQQHQLNLLIKDQQEKKILVESNVSRRDELLMQSIRETQEVKKMLLSLKEVEEAIKEIASERQKRWWQRLFRK